MKTAIFFILSYIFFIASTSYYLKVRRLIIQQNNIEQEAFAKMKLELDTICADGVENFSINGENIKVICKNRE